MKGARGTGRLKSPPPIAIGACGFSRTSWLPEVPAGWEVKKIGSLFSERRQKVSDKDYPPLSVAKMGVVPQLDDAAKTNDGDNRKLVCAGDFVINSRSDRKGSCGVSDRDGSVSLINIVLTPRTEWNNRYGHYLMRCQPFSEEFYHYGRGIVADLWTTRFREMKNIFLPVPPLDEQRRIVAYLDEASGKIDKLAAAKAREVELLKELKQRVIADAIIGARGLSRAKKTSTRATGIAWLPEVPVGWEVVPLKRCLSSPMQYGANESAEFSDPLWPRYIRITDIDDDGNLKKDTFKSLPPEKAKEYLLTKGDVLFARSGATVGKAYLHKEADVYGACFAGYLIKAQCNYRLLPEFLFFYTKSSIYQNWKNSIFIQATIQNIGADKYNNMPIPVPPLDEQRRIVAYLDAECAKIDKLAAAAAREVELLKELKQRLIADVVTGGAAKAARSDKARERLGAARSDRIKD